MKKVMLGIFLLSLSFQSEARISVTPFWLDFFEVPKNSCEESRRQIVITNTGNEAVHLRLDCQNHFGGGFDQSFFYDDEDCRGVLEPGESCKTRVYFKSRRTGNFSGRIGVESIGGSDRESVNLSARVPRNPTSGFPSPVCDFVRRCH